MVPPAGSPPLMNTVYSTPPAICVVSVWDAEQTGKKLGRRLGVGGQQLGPGDGAVLIAHLRADAAARLPEGDHATGRVLDQHHAAGVEHVERLHQQRAPQCGDARSGRVNVVDGEIHVPARWDAHLGLLAPLGEDRRGMGAVHQRH